MSEEDLSQIDPSQIESSVAASDEEEETRPVKKTISNRGKMTEAKLANLQKAREAKAAKSAQKKRLNQYPKGPKREAAEQRYQESMLDEVERRANERAKELIEKQKMEAELAEFRAYKERMLAEQQEATSKTETKTKSKKATEKNGKAEKPVKAAKSKAPKPESSKPRKKKSKVVDDHEKEECVVEGGDAPGGYGMTQTLTPGWDVREWLGY